MNERMQESLSALMDDEANELELQRLLKHSDAGELRSAWARMHGASAVVRGDRDAALLSPKFADLAFADGVAAGLDGESDVESANAGSGFVSTALRPLASFAVAASVFAVVLVVSQFYGLGPDAADAVGSQQIANQVSTVGPVNALGGAAMTASFGGQTVVAQPAVAVGYDQIARKRLQRYLVPHTDAASLNTPQGMMPYARVASFPVDAQD
ncbi:anti-anti-sigma factor [Halieaceae bacterium IMCC14734]|uniref:Anti-anti-sigma factor n=1 Tax=Candidatus Litorirhabdus singularis TaxID=2518993 RepID=A0ABT3THV1_9GAMM|nr:sigma-E factor negative regulatory protein [Candidatus Litorirhabdus singularis]MCX2981849.1 anti-anti-sigma factor [Candidatus Litorirhabdus singularis]